MAELSDALAETFGGVSPEVAASCRLRARQIRAGEEIKVPGWRVPGWARGGFTMDDQLILGEDNVLRLDTDFHGG